MNRGHEYHERIGPELAGRPLLAYLATRYRHSTETEWARRIEGEIIPSDRPGETLFLSPSRRNGITYTSQSPASLLPKTTHRPSGDTWAWSTREPDWTSSSGSPVVSGETGKVIFVQFFAGH